MTGKAAMLFAMTLLWWVFGTPPDDTSRGSFADSGQVREVVADGSQRAVRELPLMQIKSASSGNAR